MRRLALPAAAAATALCVTLLTGCQGPDLASAPAPASPAVSSPAAVTSPTPTAPTASTVEDSSPASPPPSRAARTAAPAADTTIAVVISDGKVTPNAENVKIKEGDTVRVTITSDVDESIHVHGYDKTAEATPGQPGAVTFTADTKGVFEIETHESGKLVAKLIVS